MVLLNCVNSLTFYLKNWLNKTTILKLNYYNQILQKNMALKRNKEQIYSQIRILNQNGEIDPLFADEDYHYSNRLNIKNLEYLMTIPTCMGYYYTIFLKSKKNSPVIVILANGGPNHMECQHLDVFNQSILDNISCCNPQISINCFFAILKILSNLQFREDWDTFLRFFLLKINYHPFDDFFKNKFHSNLADENINDSIDCIKLEISDNKIYQKIITLFDMNN